MTQRNKWWALDQVTALWYEGGRQLRFEGTNRFYHIVTSGRPTGGGRCEVEGQETVLSMRVRDFAGRDPRQDGLSSYWIDGESFTPKGAP